MADMMDLINSTVQNIQDPMGLSNLDPSQLFDQSKDGDANWASDAVQQSPPQVQQSLVASTQVMLPSANINLGSVNLGGPDGAGPMPSSLAARSQRSQLLAVASHSAGRRITVKFLKRMLRSKVGIDAIVALTKLTAQAILWLISTAPRRGARGPFMRTVVKRVKRGRSAEHQLRKYAFRAGIHQHHTASAKRSRKGK